MPEIICNTSPLQYLHQIKHLHILPSLVKNIVVPPAVGKELAEGISLGMDVPEIEHLDWITVRTPKAILAERLVGDLGLGETEVLMLALELPDAIVLFDDYAARLTARTLGIPVKGTLGLLLDGKRAGLISAVKPLLDRLQELRFRLKSETRAAVLELAGETPSS